MPADGAAGVLDRHLGREHRARAHDVGRHAGHVGQDADLERLLLCVGSAKPTTVRLASAALASADP